MKRNLSRCRRLAGRTLLVVAVCALAPDLAAQTFTPIRVNAGGSSYTDGASNVWSADTGYNTGYVASTGSAIGGTTDDTLFQSLRWAPAFAYSFTVPNGVYKVKLLFAESWSGAYVVGGRRFSVQLEGSTALSDIDVYAEVGATAALTKTATVAVTDGQINIGFVDILNYPFVNAIEITAPVEPSAPTSFLTFPFSTSQVNLSWAASIDDVGVTGYEVERCEGASCTNFAMVAGPSGTSYEDSGLTASTTYRYRVRAVDTSGNRGDYSPIQAAVPSATGPQPLRINAGGSAYTDSSSNLWSADSGFNTGNVASVGAAIGGTTDDTLYQTLRWDSGGGSELEYALAVVAPGQYQVRLHFAETYSGAFSVGARVFDAQLEGVTALSDIDVFDEVGANAALVKTATTGVSDGQVNLRFVHGADNPFVNAIEVLWVAPADGAAPSAPTGFSAVPTSGAAVALTWSASTDNVGVAGYAIERCTGSGCNDFAEIATASGVSRHDTGLASNTTYRYRVRAFDATGNRSAYSSVEDATTPNASAEYVYDELGRLVLVTMASGASVVYSYDESGNVTAIIRTEP